MSDDHGERIARLEQAQTDLYRRMEDVGQAQTRAFQAIEGLAVQNSRLAATVETTCAAQREREHQIVDRVVVLERGVSDAARTSSARWWQVAVIVIAAALPGIAWLVVYGKVLP